MSRRVRPWMHKQQTVLNLLLLEKGVSGKVLQHFKVIKFEFAPGSVQNIGTDRRAVAMTCDIIAFTISSCLLKFTKPLRCVASLICVIAPRHHGK